MKNLKKLIEYCLKQGFDINIGTTKKGKKYVCDIIDSESGLGEHYVGDTLNDVIEQGIIFFEQLY